MKNLSNIIITLYTLYSELDPDPGSLEKTDPLPKFIIMAKNSFLVNLRVLISNMTIIFSKFHSKDTQGADLKYGNKLIKFWPKSI